MLFAIFVVDTDTQQQITIAIIQNVTLICSDVHDIITEGFLTFSYIIILAHFLLSAQAAINPMPGTYLM